MKKIKENEINNVNGVNKYIIEIENEIIISEESINNEKKRK